MYIFFFMIGTYFDYFDPSIMLCWYRNTEANALFCSRLSSLSHRIINPSATRRFFSSSSAHNFSRKVRSTSSWIRTLWIYSSILIYYSPNCILPRCNTNQLSDIYFFMSNSVLKVSTTNIETSVYSLRSLYNEPF